MSLSMLILLLFVLFAVCVGVILRNVQKLKRPRRRFQVGRSIRSRAHPVRGRRMSYTELARERRANPPSTVPPSDTTPPGA